MVLSTTQMFSTKQAEQSFAVRLTLPAAWSWTWFEASLYSVLRQH